MKNIRNLKIKMVMWVLGFIISLMLILALMLAPSAGGFLIAIIGLVLFVVSIIKIKHTVKKLKMACPNCGELFLIDNCRYEEEARETNSLGDVSVSVKFIAECTNCEKEKILTKKYTIYTAPRYKVIDNESKQISKEKAHDIKRQLQKQRKKLLVKKI